MDNLLTPASMWADDYLSGTTGFHELEGHPFVADGCALLFCTEGRAVVTANSRRQTFRRGDVALLFSDVLFVPRRVSPAFAVRYLCLSDKLMEEVYYQMTSASFWELVYDRPVLRPDAGERSLVDAWFRQMEWVVARCTGEARAGLLFDGVTALFRAVDCRTAASPLGSEHHKRDRAWALSGKFLSLLTRHCRSTREVSFYADKLCITTDYLYKICTRVLQQSPKELIEQQTANELKRLLLGTNLSVKDLATEFHFEDPSYLCRFFRRLTGCSPTDFRNA